MKSINKETNDTKTFEEIKEILKGKNMVQKYNLAYEELMKLDREQCQNDCRYYTLYELLKRRFNPNPHSWEKHFEKLMNAEKYFNIIYKWVENYGSGDSLFALLSCYGLGIGTKINDSKLIEYCKRYLDKKSKEKLWEIRDNKYGTFKFNGDVMNYEINYTTNDKLWAYVNYDEVMRIEYYRDLTDSELESLTEQYVKDRYYLRKMKQQMESLHFT